MKRGNILVNLAVAIVLVLSASVVFVEDASAGDPLFVPGNPSCASLGYGTHALKIEYDFNGVHDIDGLNSVAVFTSDDVYFDWSSTLSIDAVIVKGGPDANAYVYIPEAYGDTGLHAPINPNTQLPYGLSHIDFCYDYEVQVEKDANPTFTRTYQWDITKSVTPASWHLFEGDTATSRYTVSVTRTGYVDSDWAVSGTISIFNPAPFSATITGVSDVVNGTVVAVSCPVAFPYELASLATLQCTYSTPLPDGTSRTNVVTVTTEGIVGGGEASAAVVFGAPTTEVNASVHVNDTNGPSWIFSGSGSVNYDRTFDCDTDSPVHNTATIVETGQSDGATVNITCHELDVSKTAETAYTRTYEWTIDKSADQTALTLSPGQQFLVNYSIHVPEPTFTDSDWLVTGNISVHNPAPIPATILSVRDYLDGTEAVVNCGVTFPYVLASGGTLTCSYSYNAPDADPLTNVAKATLQNHDYSYAHPPIASGTTIFESSAVPVIFGDPTTVMDECIDVSDTYAGSLGTVCVGDAPWTSTYARWIGPYEACGNYTVSNTASFITNDNGLTGDDTWTIAIAVPCAGCTLTQGYWKTHSIFGPAPYDDTWAGRELWPFFDTGVSWIGTFWMAPKKGDAYYILAHQYLAAVLNQDNGAYVPSEVEASMAAAEVLLATYDPNVKGKGQTAIRSAFLYHASILASYNQGVIGPGHCSE